MYFQPTVVQERGPEEIVTGMASQEIKWFYGDEKKGQWVGPMSLADLDELKRIGTIALLSHKLTE